MVVWAGSVGSTHAVSAAMRDKNETRFYLSVSCRQFRAAVSIVYR